MSRERNEQASRICSYATRGRAACAAVGQADQARQGLRIEDRSRPLTRRPVDRCQKYREGDGDQGAEGLDDLFSRRRQGCEGCAGCIGELGQRGFPGWTIRHIAPPIASRVCPRLLGLRWDSFCVWSPLNWRRAKLAPLRARRWHLPTRWKRRGSISLRLPARSGTTTLKPFCRFRSPCSKTKIWSHRPLRLLPAARPPIAPGWRRSMRKSQHTTRRTILTSAPAPRICETCETVCCGAFPVKSTRPCHRVRSSQPKTCRLPCSFQPTGAMVVLSCIAAVLQAMWPSSPAPAACR